MPYASPGVRSHTILILPAPDLSDYHRFGPWIDLAATETSKRLLVFLVSPLFESVNEEEDTFQWKDLERLLSFVYTRASKVAIKLDRVLMNIDVVLHSVQGTLLSGVERLSSVLWDVVFTPNNVRFESFPDWVANVPRFWLQTAINSAEHAGNPPSGSARSARYPIVVLGGTFDHLHVGHKILLSMAAWIASQKVIVGVTGETGHDVYDIGYMTTGTTDDTLLTRKANRDVLESIEQRMQGVRSFLELFRPQITVEVVPISDVYGPTATDPDIQALVVSKETLSGAAAIAELREEQSLPPLETYVIDVIAGESDRDLGAEEPAESLRTAKMSSTYIRTWITQQKSK